MFKWNLRIGKCCFLQATVQGILVAALFWSHQISQILQVIAALSCAQVVWILAYLVIHQSSHFFLFYSQYVLFIEKSLHSLLVKNLFEVKTIGNGWQRRSYHSLGIWWRGCKTLGPQHHCTITTVFWACWWHLQFMLEP